MSNSVLISSSDSEEGEIHTDDEELSDVGVPTSEKGKIPSLHLEDLSSCDEVFSSGSMKSTLYNKDGHFTKVGRRERSTTTQFKEKEKNLEPSKRKCHRKRLQPYISITLKHDLKQDDKNIRRRHIQKRKHRVSISTDSEDCSQEENLKFNSRRDTKRIHTTDTSKNVKTKSKSPIRPQHNLKKPTKIIEPPATMLVSCPEKAAPKTSLKRRLMNMMTFSNTEGEQIPPPELFSEKIPTDISITKELEKNEPVKNEAEPGKRSKQNHKMEEDLRQDESPQKIQEKPVVQANVNHIEKLQKDVKIACFEASGMVSTEGNIANIAAGSRINAGLAIDEDLAVLRKLALESSTSAANNRKATQKEPPVVDEELDDLTELRLQALRSAVLKKHNARKAKAAALASANAKSSVGSTSKQLPPSPPTQGHEGLASAISNALPSQPAQAIDTNGNQCDEQSLEYDKTTLIVDMDLENTSDDDSPPDSNSFTNSDLMIHKNYLEPLGENLSPYYIPEQWTPITEDDDYVESKIVDNTFNVNSYNIGSGYENTSSIGQLLHIPFKPSLCHSQPLPGLQPIAIPPQTYHQEISATLEPQPIQPKTTRNKYSVRPNLVELPMAPISKDNQLIQHSSLNSKERLSDPTATFCTKSKSQSTFVPQVSSSLVQINLNAGTARDGVNLNDKKEITNRKTVVDDTDTHKRVERAHSEILASNETPSSIEAADTSDAENMDIASMIVVDEIICTSPEPDNGKPTVPSTVPMPTLNVLTDVPVPSSRYTSRSVVHNNAPLRIVHPPKHKTVPKEKTPPVNPFIINNLKRVMLLKKRLSEAASASENYRLLTLNQSKSHLETMKSNQMSFISVSQTKNIPIRNKESSRRFVIHLGDDSDSDDDGQSISRVYVPLPARTIINERALPPGSHVNQQNVFSTTHDPLFSAKLDAFLKDTREKHDRKAALMKQKEKVVQTAPSTSVSKTFSANATASTCATIKMPVKAVQQTGTITSTNAPVCTIKLPVKAGLQTGTAASIGATASSTRGSVKMPVRAGKEMGTIVSANAPVSTIKMPVKAAQLTGAVSSVTATAAAAASSTRGSIKMPVKAVKKAETSPSPNAAASTFQMPVKASQQIDAVAPVTATASSTRGSIKTTVKGTRQTETNTHVMNTASSSGSAQTSNITAPVAVNNMSVSKTVNSQAPKKVVKQMVHSVAAVDIEGPQSNKTCASKMVQANVSRSSLPVRAQTVLLPTPKPVSLTATARISTSVHVYNNSKMEKKNMSSITNEVQITTNVKKPVKRNLAASMNDMTLELTESKLLKERTALLLDLTLILDHLNESSKVEEAINEMQETIAQQKQIVDLAQRTIKLTQERIACAAKKKEHTFKLIHDKRKIVTRKRDLCHKMRMECVNLGTKLRGQSYSAPQPLETELCLRLKEVAAGITKTFKDVSPQKRGESFMSISPASFSLGVQSTIPQQPYTTVVKASKHMTSEVSRSLEPRDPSESSFPVLQTDRGHSDLSLPNSRSSEDKFSRIFIFDCPYEINGICGDVSDCPFNHRKQR